ncbi:MAG: DNA mismatch repair protein MutS, partial [Clostridia bacterium]|nr:DNA mismatch repair protein MutS [Clostridia bacterium]
MALSPMMQQYFEIKEKYKDYILMYRLGDFYEMFFDDALTASKELELTLTGRDCGEEERAPMCGVPFHKSDVYIGRLVEKGFKVALCEQMEDPATAKGLVKREVVRVITPGTITIPDAIEETSNNFMVCVLKDGTSFGFVAADASTGELYATEFTSESAKSDVLNEIAKFAPSEAIYNNSLAEDKYAFNIIT